MDRLSTDAIGQAEERIARRAVERYGLSPEAVVCDASSVATLVDSAEAAPASRLSSMALGVSLDGSVPLCHDIYHGDEAAGLPEAMAVISERLDSSALTLVSGKGNPAANQALARELGLGLVGSLAATAHQELLEVPPHEFRQLEGTGGALAYRTERELYGRKFTVVVCKSADWAESEARSFAQALHAAGRRLRELQGTVERGRHRMDAPACRKRVEEILRRRWLGEVVDVDFDLRARRFGFRTDEQVLARVRTLEFGKRIIFTDRHEWPDERIVSAYRAQGQAEEALAGLLQEAALASLAPDFRRTEQSLRVHAFHGTLALALVRLIEREVSRADIGLHGGLALPALAGIREAVLTYPPAGGKRGRPRVRTQLTTLDVAQRELFDLFRLGRLA
jgi:transposase